MNKQPSVYVWVEGVHPVEVSLNKEVYWYWPDGTAVVVIVKEIGPLEAGMVVKESKDVSRV